MAFDLVVKNGTVIDGTGSPRRQADIGVAKGKIAEVGKINEAGKRSIDAFGLVVAPGFIDPHTHYDAQICWDPLVTCSSWHGVTSVVMGNCGVGIAPCKPGAHEIATWDLVNVEGIPFEALNRGVTWDWITFPEFMNAAQRRTSGINLAFMAPLSPFRHFVMGEESMERSATAVETAKVGALLKEALEAGAFGWSTTILPQQIGYRGRPLACRLASRDEIKAYCGVLRELGKGVIEVALTKRPGTVFEDEQEVLELLVNESARPVTWIGIAEKHSEETLARLEPIIRRGGIPQVLEPFVAQLDLRHPYMFGDNESWNQAVNRTPEEQKEIYRDPEFRARWRDEMKNPRLFRGAWHRMEVFEVSNPAMKPMEFKTVAEIAEQRGADPLDTFLDLALEDDLKLQYRIAEEFREAGVRQLIIDDRCMIGASDGGAHLDMFCGAGYCTHLLGHWVREKQALTLERAVQRLTAEPADFFGIQNRGRIRQGFAADLTIFDPQTVGSAGAAQMHYDLPGGGRRMLIPAQGIEYTIVNGQVLDQHGQHSGARPGTVLRSVAS
jgi:N-acyl-D-amino-acid deacylase